MTNEINVELFRFDAKLDYLPYYKTYIIEYNDRDTILSLLNKVNAIDKFDYEATNEFNMKINNLYLSAKEHISNIVALTSNNFKIEPVSMFRATRDLLIDKKDYLKNILMFDKFINPMEMDEYAQSLELDYYASNTYNFNRDYIGDHALLIASDIIKHTPEFTKDILKIISDKAHGIWFHTSLKNRVFNYDLKKEQKIQNLLHMLPKAKNSQINNSSLLNIDAVEISQFFNGFNIASYEGISKDSCTSLINDSRASYVELNQKYEDLAPYSTLVDSEFSLKIAGEILLEAKDNNADFLVVRGNGDIMLFDGKQKSIEKAVGREIQLPVITQKQFSLLLSGEKDVIKLKINTHKVKVSFL
ncbi:MAG: DUF5644 domain-containing protein [Fluviicola sp.]|nr:DUF5644 domain-containing protein [Fluviicola sp.]